MTVTRLRRTVGGSDAAAACGIDPHRSAVAAWLEITGRAARPATEAMLWGQRIEPLIYATLEADGHELLPAPSEGFRDSERKWMTGHPAGFATVDGERGLLEIKTAGAWQRTKWNDTGLPIEYVAQVHHYLHLTGLRVALVACLVDGQELVVRMVYRDDRAIELMLEMEEAFWKYVRLDRPPPPDGSKSARDAYLELYPEARPGRTYRLTRDEFRALQELRARKEQAKAISEQADKLENVLRAAIGDAELAISPHDTPEIHYSNVTSRRLDVTRLKAERPDVYAEYLAETTGRRFTVA